MWTNVLRTMVDANKFAPTLRAVSWNARVGQDFRLTLSMDAHVWVGFIPRNIEGEVTFFAYKLFNHQQIPRSRHQRMSVAKWSRIVSGHLHQLVR